MKVNEQEKKRMDTRRQFNSFNSFKKKPKSRGNWTCNVTFRAKGVV